jgi:uncharacterized iron-regulated membrane protein
MTQPADSVLVLLGVLALLGVTVIGFVMWRYRIPPRADRDESGLWSTW